MTVSTPSISSTSTQTLDQLAVNTIRFLSMDAVQKAKSGHPGLPMGCADFAFTLFTRFLKFNPRNPEWADRDRFVLSAGHGSMLLYSLLHLTGYDLPLEELTKFRQWGSMTPGHPEYSDAPGVETTTGPLGQGAGNAVGFALAERLLAARFNTPKHEIVDHFTYGLVSDGDLMEGISGEAASLAGHLGLGKLICFYDDNGITIEGSTEIAFTEDVGKRYEAYGWHVLRCDGHDRDAIAAAIEAGQKETSRPTIIVGKTTIAWGSPNKAGTHDAHGAPLGDDEIAATRKALGWELGPFEIPDAVRPVYAAPGNAGEQRNKKWDKLIAGYRESEPEKAAVWDRTQAGELPTGIDAALPKWEEGEKLATRAASGKTINALAPVVPEMIGGSADLSPSNNTDVKNEGSVTPEDFGGRNLHFGIREHAMGAIMNGMSLHGGIRPYGGTFLIFSDYVRPSIRLAGLMKQPVIYVFTHDSFFLGEDGPTHQPIEHLASMRAMPNVRVLRPACPNETAAAWKMALEHKTGPTTLALTRQGLPAMEAGCYGKGVEKGAYVAKSESGSTPDVILMASGSEVSLAIEAAKVLEGKKIDARVVSMPCWEIFAEQSQDYKDSVLPPAVTARVAIEAGTSFGWERYVGTSGRVVCRDTFGASAPAEILAEKFGFTPENVASVASEVVGK
jgi:transketolase